MNVCMNWHVLYKSYLLGYTVREVSGCAGVVALGWLRWVVALGWLRWGGCAGVVALGGCAGVVALGWLRWGDYAGVVALGGCAGVVALGWLRWGGSYHSLLPHWQFHMDHQQLNCNTRTKKQIYHSRETHNAHIPNYVACFLVFHDYPLMDNTGY